MALARVELIVAKPIEEHNDHVASLWKAQDLASPGAVEALDLDAERIERCRNQLAQVSASKIRSDQSRPGEVEGLRHPRTPMTS